MTERERFEAWAIRELDLFSRPEFRGERYVNANVQDCWQAWKSRAELDSSKMEQATISSN